MNPGTLYVVATPIGNLEDMTLRALRVLKEVGLVACEDTRRTRTLLSHFGIHVPVTSYFEHNKLTKGPAILRALREGKSVALVTDAGTPGISDPGFLLVRAARAGRGARGAGARAVRRHRRALGRRRARRPVRLRGLPAGEARPQAAPARSAPRSRDDRGLLRVAAPDPGLARGDRQVFGDREIVAAREMTKQFEEIVRGTARRLAERFAAGRVRGEFTLIIPYTKGPC